MPSDSIVQAVTSAPSYPRIPSCVGVVSSPVLRLDGTVAMGPGYDPQTGWYIETRCEYPPLMPPEQAFALLDDILLDFPWAAASHKSACLAALITLVARGAYEGCTPSFLFDGNRSRIGKGLETDVITMISEGRKAARQIYSKSHEEMRKLLTTTCIGGSPYLIFDNVRGSFGHGPLEMMLTTGRWTDRILGVNQNVDLPVNVVVMATGNNIRVVGDMPGRIITCRLETDLEKPRERTGFKYPDLLGHVKDNRPLLVVAALSIPAAYIKAGSPTQKLKAFGGFEQWSALVRGCLVWAGRPDPLETLPQKPAEVRVEDEREELRALMAAWSELQQPPCTLAYVFGLLDQSPDKRYPIMRAFLAARPKDRSRETFIAYLLRHYRGRILDSKRFEHDTRKTPKWFLEQVGGV